MAFEKIECPIGVNSRHQETVSRIPAKGVGVDGPRRHRLCQNEVVADLKQRGPSVEQISRIGMDTSKHFFQLHGVNAAEKVVLRKKLRRKEMVAFFKALAPTVIGIEACGASHHWARILRSFGHEVKLIAPQLVKPYVKRGKNDTADAEALCEAMSRPTMRFVPVKTAEQQAALMMVALRDRLIRNRTQLSNAIRGYAAEFGFTAARGMAHIDPLLDRIQADENVPVLARELFAAQAEEYAQLQAQIAEVDAKLMAWHKADECSRRLAKIPGVGPIGAALLMMKTPAPEMFRSGRQFAAWIGLTPKGLPNTRIYVGNLYSIQNFPVPTGPVVSAFNSTVAAVVGNVNTGCGGRIKVADIYTAFLGPQQGLLLINRNGAGQYEVHPSNAGHRAIAQAFIAAK